MAEVSTFRCDECGILKQEANHWFRAGTATGRFVICGWEDKLLFGIPKGQEMEVQILRLCGMECAVKAMTKALTESK